MKKIVRVSRENIDQIKGILDESQELARCRTISAEDIVGAAEKLTDYLKISKKAMEGVSVRVDENARTFPNCYKGVPLSTQFSMTYRHGEWRLDWIERKAVRYPTLKYEITLTEKAEEEVLKAVSKVKF